MKKQNNNDKKNNKNLLYWSILIFVTLVCLAVILYQMYNIKDQDDKILPYTDLIKQITVRNVDKIEMTTGAATAKVTLKEIISQEELEERLSKVEKEEQFEETKSEEVNENDDNKEVNKELIKTAIIPNNQSFVELIQQETLKGQEKQLDILVNY